MPVREVSITDDQERKMSFLSYLIIDVVEHVFPERVENRRGHQESTHAHP